MKKPRGKKPGRSLTPEEKHLWRTHTRDFEKLPHAAVPEEEVFSMPEESAPALRLKKLPAAPVKTVTRKTSPAVLDAGDVTQMDGRLAARFKKGALPIEATLDLHGHTRDSADTALEKFIHRASNSGKRMLLIITGKGRPTTDGEPGGIIKNAVAHWLGEGHLRPYILAFSPAQQKHGGAGAFYVLLKRKR